MAYQIYMCNNDKEFVSKKNDLDKDLFMTKTNRVDVDRKVNITIKYFSAVLSSHLNPSSNVLTIYISEEYIKEKLGIISVHTFTKRYKR